ncbi:Heat shock protein [Echinococcus granulosus]|uniref:Heat shock protein n=1 Tax=Echinococcus granulosus TaxID=6210 RepID=W6U9X5_ECHGR|nr:Heat shock protein [Echinococcus granulosus]EUB58188.1 Heat shock protein [Echinococcus granulosus]
MVLLPEQVLAMHLHKLALVTESNLGTKVVDVVLSVPSYYTDRERNAFLDAARIAGLNCMRLVNETTAIGIAYGYLKKDLPAVGQPSRNVAFVSLGNSNLQVAIVAFNAGKMRVISTAWDPCLGGRDFDMCIFRHLVKEIEKKYNLKVMSNAKACVRLLKSCEGLKKTMSANSTEIPINVECLMEDTDISLKMKREFFEEICRPLLLRVKQTMERALALSTLKLGDLYSVELVGGGTRIPAVKTLVREVFGMEGSTTLNADEAVARGCALQAAICSSTRRFREFSIVDACPYSISLHWKPTDGGVVVGDRDSSEIVKNNSCEIFKHLSSVPASKKLTFYRKSGFDLTASYSHPEGLHIGDSRIGSFLIKDIVPTPPDNCCQVRIEARVNSNGIFTICNACVLERVVEKVEVAIEDPKPEASTVANAIETDMETETQPPKTEGGVEQPPTGGAASGTTETAVANQSPSQPTRRIEKKIVLRPRDVAVKAMTFQLPHTQMDEFANFQKLEEICNPIILKPKPAPPPPPPKPASPESDKTTSFPDGGEAFELKPATIVVTGDIHEMALLKRKMKEIEKLLGEKVLELDRAEERVASLKAEHKRNVYETTEAKVKLETELTNMKSDLAKARTFAQRAERMAMQANHEKEAQV